MTTTSGAEWFSIEGDLPDLPRSLGDFTILLIMTGRLIATDAGVWTTDDIDGRITHIGSHLILITVCHFVRVDMLVSARKR
jgi:hypothetical protein